MRLRRLYISAIGTALLMAAVAVSLYRARSSSTGKIRNVLIISIDTCRADHLGCYGYTRNTSPNIDALAREGILVEHAVTPVPITLPAHSSMMTGTIPPYHKVRDNVSYRLDDSNTTLADILSENGFSTGAIVGAFVLDAQFGLNSGFQTYNDDIKDGADEDIFYFNERKASEISGLANKWLQDHHKEKFFLFLHYFDPHTPYRMHPQHIYTSQGDTDAEKDSYDSEIAYTDRHIGMVIDKLKELDLYDSTMIIVTSDHGEGLGDHGEQSHGFFIYHSTLHVPLILKIPGAPKGVTIEQVAGLIDIVPTVCGSLGIDAGRHVQGRNLNDYLRGNKQAQTDRSLYCESLMPTKYQLSPLLGLVDNQWQYIHSAQPELYDLDKDPRETDNVAGKYPDHASSMYDNIISILDKNSSKDASGNRLHADEQTINRLKSLGYVADRTVSEDIQLHHANTSQKQFIETYNFMQSFLALAAQQKFGEAKILALDMLAKHPDMKQACFYLGTIAVAEENTEKIIRYFSQYLQLADSETTASQMQVLSNQEMAFAHIKLGNQFDKSGDFDRAIDHYVSSISFNPYSPNTHHTLALLYTRLKRYEEAAASFNETIKLEPDDENALNNMAWVLSTAPHSKAYEPARGLKLATRACQLTEYDNPGFLDTLAVAYAANGQFTNAIKTTQKAIELAHSAALTSLVNEFTDRLTKYKLNQPYIEPVK